MHWWKKPQKIDDIDVVGVEPTPLRDLYHLLLRAPWSIVLLSAGVVYVLLNFVFAFLYLEVGGVVGADAGSLTDYFFFSVQTMATIGYGVMYPKSYAADVLVTLEALIGIGTVAMYTGLLFAKFSAPRARVRFASRMVIAPMNGVPTVMLRMGNERSSMIVEATVRVLMYRTEITDEGVRMYRMYDLPLERERAPALSRSWTVLHRIVPGSMLFGATPASLVKDEVEFSISVVGIDEATGQTLHARWRYLDKDVRWGARHVDLLTDRADGGLTLDLSRFDEVVDTVPTPAFPYPASAGPTGENSV